MMAALNIGVLANQLRKAGEAGGRRLGRLRRLRRRRGPVHVRARREAPGVAASRVPHGPPRAQARGLQGEGLENERPRRALSFDPLRRA